MYQHREAERALERAEEAVSEAQQALAAMVDPDDIETEVGQIADNLRDAYNSAETLLTTDLEDAEEAIRALIAELSNLCTDASDLYNRL
jgi:predicted DNA-binding protein (UPF0278 family)